MKQPGGSPQPRTAAARSAPGSDGELHATARELPAGSRLSPEPDTIRPGKPVRAAFLCGGEATAVAAQRGGRAILVLWTAAILATPIARRNLGPASSLPMAMLSGKEAARSLLLEERRS